MTRPLNDALGWGVQYAMPAFGILALIFGIRDPVLAWAGTAALALAGLSRFSAANGYRLASPGWTRIVTHGCWEVPYSFMARHKGRPFLFQRQFDSRTGDLPAAYDVYALPGEVDAKGLRFTGFEPPRGSVGLGIARVSALRFGHDGSGLVETTTLARALAAAALPIDAPAGIDPSPNRAARPAGVTILASLFVLNIGLYAVLLVLSLARPDLLSAPLEWLSVDGATGLRELLRLGSFLPAYFATMAVAVGLLARGMWRLRNWARFVTMALAVVSLPASVTGVAAAIAQGDPSGTALSLLRVGLCPLLFWYLRRPRVRSAFGSAR